MEIEFNKSNLQSTINASNSIEGLNIYKNGAKGAIEYWKDHKNKNHPQAEANIKFFTDAIELCEAKLKKINS